MRSEEIMKLWSMLKNKYNASQTAKTTSEAETAQEEAQEEVELPDIGFA